MDDAIAAILTDLQTSLETVPLYHFLHTINKHAGPPPAGINLKPPYALLQPVSEPADPPNRYRTESAAIFGINVWGHRATCMDIARNLEWLRAHTVGSYGTSSNLRYSLWTRTFNREDWLIDGYEAWNLSTTYRCQYENLAAHTPQGGRMM